MAVSLHAQIRWEMHPAKRRPGNDGLSSQKPYLYRLDVYTAGATAKADEISIIIPNQICAELQISLPLQLISCCQRYYMRT